MRFEYPLNVYVDEDFRENFLKSQKFSNFQKSQKLNIIQKEKTAEEIVDELNHQVIVSKEKLGGKGRFFLNHPNPSLIKLKEVK